MWKIKSKNAPSLDRLCGWTNRTTFPPQLLQIIIFSVDESGKSLVKLEGESEKNNICRVLFPTQICQFWDNDRDSAKEFSLGGQSAISLMLMF